MSDMYAKVFSEDELVFLRFESPALRDAWVARTNLAVESHHSRRLQDIKKARKRYSSSSANVMDGGLFHGRDFGSMRGGGDAMLDALSTRSSPAISDMDGYFGDMGMGRAWSVSSRGSNLSALSAKWIPDAEVLRCYIVHVLTT
ncbi:hypothetical protein HK101_005418 [Irineochytrium annulatum]|nr:hypothetical protein HK101_005418 [Irineochytrium annulatum]